MRILLANTSTLPDRMGGGERALWHLARGLRERGHDVRIVVPWMNRNHPPASLIDGVSIHRYSDRFHSFATLYLPSLAAARGAIARELRQWRPDIVHTHQGISGVAAGLAGA
ncbi:MAG: glycosyltransferase, partial [Candidatus Rokubacteria bacterium]|nr:glycosyltransferase [Candidatus Rokubacteria bacterium]